MDDYSNMDYYTMYNANFEETPSSDADDTDREDPIDFGQMYQSLSNNKSDVNKRLELFALLQRQLRDGSIVPARIAAYHTQLCVDLVAKFNTRTGVGELVSSEKLIVPMLQFLQEVFLMGDRTFIAVTLKSQLLSNLVKLVSIYADRTDQMTKNLLRICAVDRVLGHSEAIAPHDALRSVIDVPDIPDVFYAGNVCKVVEMQHRYDCECPECRETPDKPPAPANLFMLYSGKIGTNIYPLRHLLQHKAAICPLPDYWEFIASRSNKIADEMCNLTKRAPTNNDACDPSEDSRTLNPGQLVAVATKFLSWMNYDPSVSTLPPLPPYMRGFVVGKCRVVLNNHHVGVWLPDFALCALCPPDKLIILPEFSAVRTFTPLVYIACAYSHTSVEVVSLAICVIYDILLKNAKRDSVRQLLEDKGPWKTVQLLRFLDSGEARTKLLAIINILIHNEKDDRGCRGVFASCLHNTLADWLVWKVFTNDKSMPELEKLEILEGLMLLIPRIEIRKWPRRSLVLQAIYALMKDEKSKVLMNSLQKCKDMLAWCQIRQDRDFRHDRGHHHHFQHNRQPYNNRTSSTFNNWRGRQRPNYNRDYWHRPQNRTLYGRQEYKDRFHPLENYTEESEDRSHYRIGRKTRMEETWYYCSIATRNMVLAPASEPGNCADVLRATLSTMVRGLIFHGAQQGLNCEVMQVTNLQDVRQPLLARLVCGMLNSGGGEIYIGLIEQGLVQGVHAPRPERDSFTQGVIDVAEYCLEPRLPPYAFRVERQLVLKSVDHVPDGDWNRFVFVIHLTPVPNVVYEIVPEKQSFIRRPPDGTTVVLTQEDSDSEDYTDILNYCWQ